MPRVATNRPAAALPAPGASPAGLPIPGWWLGVALFAAAFLAYWPALHGTFLWDDDGHITRADLRSLAGLGRIWFEPGATQQYYPVLHTAFWLEHFVLGDTPTGYHVINVLLHATAACLFAGLLRRLAVPGAWLAAFLFALHPVCVESVAWISEQKNTLSLVFYLLAARAYLRFDASRRPAHYAAALGLFFLALGTKTVTASLPAALLVIFWWQRGRIEVRRDVAPLLPWFGLALVAGVTTAWVEHTLIGAEHNEFELDLVQRGLLASRVLWFYLGKLLVPANLSFIYPRWSIDPGAARPYVFLAGIALLLFVAWRGRQRRGPIAAGLLFAGALFPALGFVNVYPFVFSFVADHFQYLASLALFALAGAGWARWAGTRRVPLAVAAVVALGLLTHEQSATYRDGITLYRTTIAKNPGAWMAHNNLGNALVNSGRAREALAHFETAAQLRPNSAEIENNFGFALLSLRDAAGAVPHLERAIRARADYIYAYNNLGLALLTLGRLPEAEARLREALALKSDYPEANLNLGLVLGQLGRNAEALPHFTLAARLRPHNAEAQFNLAIALALAERRAEALPHFERAVQLAPQRPDMQHAYGRVLALEGRTAEAIARYRAALALAPNFTEARAHLAEAMAQLEGRKPLD